MFCTTEIIHRGLSAEILRETFVSKTSLYNLLRNNTFEIRQVYSDSAYQGTETLSFLGLKILGLVPVELNNQRTSKLNAHTQASDNFSATESRLKMTKNAFYFTLKFLFVLKIFEFSYCLFDHVEKWFD